MQSKEVRATQISRDITALYEQVHRKHLQLISERDAKIHRRDALQAEYRATAARTSDQLVLDDMLRELEALDDEIVDLAFTVESHFVILEKTLRDISQQVKSMLHREWYKPILRMVSMRKVKKLRGATDTEDYNAVRDLSLKICEKINNFVSKNMQDAAAAAEARERIAAIHEELNRGAKADRDSHMAALRAKYGAPTAAAAPVTAIPTVLTPADMSAPAEAAAPTDTKKNS